MDVKFIAFVTSFSELSQSTARIISRSFRKTVNMEEIKKEMQYWGLTIQENCQETNYIHLYLISLTHNVNGV